MLRLSLPSYEFAFTFSLMVSRADFRSSFPLAPPAAATPVFGLVSADAAPPAAGLPVAAPAYGY
jgi:hypothetical protein